MISLKWNLEYVDFKFPTFSEEKITTPAGGHPGRRRAAAGSAEKFSNFHRRPFTKSHFSPHIFGDFFQICFPSGGGGAWGGTRGSRKVHDRISKVVRDIKAPRNVTLEKKSENPCANARAQEEKARAGRARRFLYFMETSRNCTRILRKSRENTVAPYATLPYARASTAHRPTKLNLQNLLN